MTHDTHSHEAPLMLSVSGARGIVGRTMTPSVAGDFAASFGSFLREWTGEKTPLLCIGRDTRPSGEMFARAAAAALAAIGCRVIDLGVVTTPTVGVMIGHRRAQGGMVITASHNPIEWNGLKCLNADGVAPPSDDAHEVIRRFREETPEYSIVEDLSVIESDDTATSVHLERVLANIDPEPIRAAGFKVVLDSVNGAGCGPGRELLERLGCEVVHLNGEPTGQFAHPPEPTAEHLTDLAEVTRTEDAAVGFAQDPDADRLAVIDEHGTYIGEEYTLVLCARRALEMDAARNSHDSTAVLAANLSTSRMIDDVANSFGATVLRSAVGEANVVDAMKPHGPRAIIGGEGNGGVIFPPVCWVRDSLSSMALVLSLLAHHRKTLSGLVDETPRYVMQKHKFDLADLGGRDAIKPMLERVRERFSDARINNVDGVRIDFDDGWIHLRPSNTEPIVRLIVEATDEARASELVQEAAQAAGM